ncbi:protein kinase domain protein [Penicillium sp. IBT 16267x]|nr:protein kinase domain protein [Penicillium sp. IBT 16267x]
MNTIRPALPRFSTFFRKKAFPMPSPGPSLPPCVLIDEEISPGYDSKVFLPSETWGGSRQSLPNLGQGWLGRVFNSMASAHTEEPETIVALKIINNNASSVGHEREVEEHISTADPSHRGRSLIRTLLDSFEVKGSGTSYSCLFIRVNSSSSLFLVGDTDPIGCLDLKLENIMVSFEDPTVLADFINSQLENPMASKIDSTGRPAYQSRNDFGPLKSLRSIPQLVDFGLATRLEEDDDWGVLPIQPDHYRAPEVILGNGWQMPADIWNLGVLLWDMIEGKELFRHIHNQQGCYNAKLHIAKMIAYLGPPPIEVIQRYQYMRDYSWPEPVRREDGRVCETMEEYFCGPFFEDNGITAFSISHELFTDSRNILGRFLYENLIPDRKLRDTVSLRERKEKRSLTSPRECSSGIQIRGKRQENWRGIPFFNKSNQAPDIFHCLLAE